MGFSRGTIARSLIWKLLERFSVQLVSFVVTIVIARILSPDEYAVIALIAIFISLGDVLVEGGLGTALVQKKDADNTDFSTIFFFSLAAASVLYLLLFLTAPAISSFYGQPGLVPVIRVLALELFLCAANSVQRAYVAKKMLFKQLFKSCLVAIILSGVVGIWMALSGYGVWALVAQTLSNQLLITVVMWFTVGWRPVAVFSRASFSRLFDFGWKILTTNFIVTLFVKMRKLVIGKMFAPQMLAFFDKGEQFPSLLMDNVNTAIQSVLLPAFSEDQDNKARVKQILRRSTMTSCLFIYPMMFGMMAVARPLVLVLLTEKWLPIVPFIQILCTANFFRPVTIANLEAIKSLGYSDITLKLEIIKKIIDVAILVVSCMFGIYAIAWGIVLYNFICLFINLYPNIRLLDYRISEQVVDALPCFLAAAVMGAAVYALTLLDIAPLALLLLQFVAGVSIYVLICEIFGIESYIYLKEIVLNKIRTRQI